MQVSIRDGQFVAIYEDKSNPLDSNGVILFDSGVVAGANNHVFFTQPFSDTSGPNGCASNLQVMQYVKKLLQILQYFSMHLHNLSHFTILV